MSKVFLVAFAVTASLGRILFDGSYTYVFSLPAGASQD
jgi:hypothetical protein